MVGKKNLQSKNFVKMKTKGNLWKGGTPPSQKGKWTDGKLGRGKNPGTIKGGGELNGKGRGRARRRHPKMFEK